MISAMLAFRACRYSGLLGSSIGNDAYHRFDTDTNHIADIRDISNVICIPNELIFLQHDVHDSKRSLNSSSFFPRQQIPALPDLLLLTGNDYAWHARPFNEVRTKGFTDWIFGCSKMLNLGSLYCLSTLCGLKAENLETEQQDVCFQDPPQKPKKP